MMRRWGVETLVLVLEVSDSRQARCGPDHRIQLLRLFSSPIAQKLRWFVCFEDEHE